MCQKKFKLHRKSIADVNAKSILHAFRISGNCAAGPNKRLSASIVPAGADIWYTTTTMFMTARTRVALIQKDCRAAPNAKKIYPPKSCACVHLVLSLRRQRRRRLHQKHDDDKVLDGKSILCTYRARGDRSKCPLGRELRATTKNGTERTVKTPHNFAIRECI